MLNSIKCVFFSVKDGHGKPRIVVWRQCDYIQDGEVECRIDEGPIAAVGKTLEPPASARRTSVTGVPAWTMT